MDTGSYYVFGLGSGADDLHYIGWTEKSPGREPQQIYSDLAGSGRDDVARWVTQALDSGAIDIFERDLDGTARRLTFARGDDYEPSWAPDNSRFVFVTSRWSKRGRYDLAIYDTLTRGVRQLTGGDDTDMEPQWNGNGSRIAFVRMDTVGRRALCTIDIDGGHLGCHEAEADQILRVIRWADPSHVLMRMTIAGRPALARVDVDNGDVVDRDTLGADALVSPDGRFAVCQCSRRGYPQRTWIVYPVERPEDFTVLRTPVVDSTGTLFVWAPTTRRARSIASVQIAADVGTPIVGAPHRLRAAAWDAAGKPIEMGIVRWRSEDTLVASIDANGVLIPKRTGTLTVVASAGGWREARATIVISEPPPVTLMDERWTEPLATSWEPFGVPYPKIVADSLVGRAFLNNGDGSFFSGAYSRRSFESRAGLWLEAELSTPVSSSNSQDQMLSLFAMSDSSLWTAWDHVTGDGPSNGMSVSCSIRYPFGRMTKHLGEQLLTTFGENEYIDVPPDLYRGRPYSLVLQILPDGRCAAALDGKVLTISANPIGTPRMHVMIAGNSVDTRMLTGRLRVGSGLAPGIRWLAAPHSAARGRESRRDLSGLIQKF
jgi:hypothetical protein